MKLAHEKCDNLIVVYFNKITEDTKLKQENITFQVGNNLEKVSDWKRITFEHVKVDVKTPITDFELATGLQLCWKYCIACAKCLSSLC